MIKNLSRNKQPLLLTSITNSKRFQKNTENKENKEKNVDEIKGNEFSSGQFSFPKLNLVKTFSNLENDETINPKDSFDEKKKRTKIKRKKMETCLKKFELFIRPINKSILEINGLRAMKDNLVKKRFIDLHKYKLKINPNNYYHNYGLNDFILITSDKRNKRSNSFDYKFNNVSSYNNIFPRDEENKSTIYKSTISRNIFNNLRIKNFKKIFSSLKCVPYRSKNLSNNNFILNTFNGQEILSNNNTLWRGKSINDIIPNKTNLEFFKSFVKNSKNLGKIKIL